MTSTHDTKQPLTTAVRGCFREQMTDYGVGGSRQSD